MNRGRVVIIGGSMAGLFAAVALRARGFDVAVCERAKDTLANRGAGIATHDQLYEAMRTAGIELHEALGVESHGRVIFDREGRELYKLDMHQVMTSWGLIYRFLRARVPAGDYHAGRTLSAIEPHGNGVSAVFTDGTRMTADWLLGADGARSTVRALVAPAIRARYAGYFGWRGLIDEARLPHTVLAQIAHRMAFCMAPGGHWLGYLVAGPDDTLAPGQRWYNWGWYRAATAPVLADHLTDAQGHYHDAGIPHHLIRPELIAAMRAEARASLAPQMQSIVAATDHPFVQGMFDLCSERLIHGRVVLIGDAAATARPHVGLGVSKAADDATSFATALAEDSEQALAAWETARLRYARAVVTWGRELGSYIGAQGDDAATRTMAAHYRRPEVLLRATAASDPQTFLRL